MACMILHNQLLDCIGIKGGGYALDEREMFEESTANPAVYTKIYHNQEVEAKK